MPTWVLYTVCVLVWGSSWHAMVYQDGVAPELSIAYRFALAAVLMVAYCIVTRRSFRFKLGDYVAMFALGFFLFSVNYILFYYASGYLPTGILAVVFCMITVMNMVNAAVMFRQPIEGRVVLGAAIGLIGLSLTFWETMEGRDFDEKVVTGLVLALIGTLCASFGNMASVSLGHRQVGIVESNTGGMCVGALISFLFALLHGSEITYNPEPSYSIALLYLAVFATIIGFGCFLTLVRRIGASRAAYSSVLFPVIALAMSAAFEGYRPHAEAIVGVALILIGNVFALRRAPRPAAASAQ